MIKTSDVFWLLRLHGVSGVGLTLFILKIFIDVSVAFIILDWLVAPEVVAYVFYVPAVLVCFLLYILNSNFTVYLIKGLKDDKGHLFRFAVPMIAVNLGLLMIGWSIAKIIH